MSRKVRQEMRRAKRPTVFSIDGSLLAPEERQRLFRGLERFANTGDDLADYNALSKAWPSFWPLNLGGGQDHRSLQWADICHVLFLGYRDTLRRVWISDPEALRCGAFPFLLGLFENIETIPHGTGVQPFDRNEGWYRIKRENPSVYVTSYPVVWPHWKSAAFTYTPMNDFQRALYLLFLESWRAKTCAKCSTYFVAQKPAQLYCSVECSNASHRANALKWWKREGAKKRAAQAKTGRRRDVHRSGRKGP